MGELQRILHEKDNNPNYENLTKKQKRNFKKKMRKKLKKAALKGKENGMSFISIDEKEEEEESSICSDKARSVDKDTMEAEDQ